MSATPDAPTVLPLDAGLKGRLYPDYTNSEKP